MEITYEEIIAAYDRPFGQLEFEGRKMPLEVLKKLFSEEQFEIIDWLPQGLAALSLNPFILTELILSTPVDKMNITVNKIVNQIPSRRILRKLVENLCHAMKEDNIKPAIAIRSILRRDIFWRINPETPVKPIEFIKNLFSSTTEEISHSILIGHHDPKKPGFLEEVLVGKYQQSDVELIEILLISQGIKNEYIVEAFKRLQETILQPRRNLSHLFCTIVKNADVYLYSILLQKLYIHLPIHNYSILYELCLTQYISQTELLVPALFNNIYFKPISQHATRHNIISYCDWLITTGNINNYEATAFTTLIHKLLSYKALNTIINILRACHLMHSEKRKLIIENLVSSCMERSRNADKDTQESMEILLDILGQTRHLSSQIAKDILIRSLGDKGVETTFTYAWFSATDVASDKVDVVLDILGTRLSFSNLEFVQIHDTLNFVATQVEDTSVLQRYSLLIMNRNKEYMSIIFNSWLKPSLKVPSVVFRVSSMAMNHFEEREFNNFVKQVREESSESWQAFIHAGNFFLRQSLRDLPGILIIARLKLQNRCAQVIDLLRSCTVLDADVIVKCLNQDSSEVLLEAILRVEEDKKLSDHYLSVYLERERRNPDDILSRYIAKVGPLTIKSVLNNFRLVTTITMKNPVFRRMVEEYIKKDTQLYLKLILVIYHYDRLILPHIFSLHSCFSSKFNIEGQTLRFGKYTIISASQSIPRPADGLLESYFFKLCVTYKKTPKDFVCRVCTEKLSGNIYQDDRDLFGIYYCSQCAESLTGGTHVTQVICGVCLEDKVEILPLQCGHPLCINCTSMLAACPICRLPLNEKRTVTVPASAMIEMFLADN